MGDCGLRRGTGHGAWGMGKDRGRRAEGKTAGRKKKAEDRRQTTEGREQIADWGLGIGDLKKQDGGWRKTAGSERQ